MTARGRFAVALVPTVAVLFLGGAVARGQTPGPSATPTTTTVPNLVNDLLKLLTPTTLPPAPPPPPTTAPPAPPPPGTPPPGPQGDSGTPPPGPQVVPPEFQKIIDAVPRTGPKNTAPLFDALGRLEDLGLTHEEIAAIGMGRFPVRGDASYVDDWLFPRFTPTFHLHKGTDIFAVRGTPVGAPADGVVTFGEAGAGGKAAYVRTADGTSYYMAHLDGYATDIPSGARVKVGQVVGYVGDTGNAQGGAPHLHFEIRPKGGEQVNPKPILDGWLADAIAAAPQILAEYDVHVPRAVTSAGVLRRLDAASPFGGMGSGVSDLLWASSFSTAGGSLRLAESEAALAAGRVDWGQAGLERAASTEDWAHTDQLARELLSPVTPRPLESVLRGGS